MFSYSTGQSKWLSGRFLVCYIFVCGVCDYQHRNDRDYIRWSLERIVCYRLFCRWGFNFLIASFEILAML